MEWEYLIDRLIKNISYWSSFVSRKTFAEKEDIKQELLLLLWQRFCRNRELEREITIYYMQKYLQYESQKMVKKLYLKNKNISLMEEYDDGTYYNILEDDIIKSKYVKEIFSELKNNLKNDKEFKALDILTMILEGKRKTEIGKQRGESLSSISMCITRKIKKQLKLILEQDKKLLKCEII